MDSGSTSASAKVTRQMGRDETGQEKHASSDVHGRGSGCELGWTELFWAGPSWAPEVAHQGLRPGSGMVKAGAGGSGCS